MEAYADVSYYRNVYQGAVIPESNIAKSLELASRHIDTLTYNRIVGRGIQSLTEFQQTVVKQVCCMLAEFEYENADALASILQSYSINGVSMSFGNSWNVVCRDGVAIKRSDYEYLAQSGLCTRVLGV